MNQLNLTPEQMDKLLRLAGEKLGTDPEQLKASFQQDGLKGVSAALSPEAQAVIGDRDKAEALLQNPAVQQLIRQLLG